MDTWIDGGVICGYCAIGGQIKAIAPVSVITTETTVAKMGRSMKKCENEDMPTALSVDFPWAGLARQRRDSTTSG